MIALKDGRADLHQWDTGRILMVDSDIDELHFAKTPIGRSLDVSVSDGEARVPDVLLQTPGNLHIWAFVGTPEDGYTKVSKVMTVHPRNKPADYVFTPQDQLTLKDIAERVEDLEEKLENDSDEDITAESIKTALGYTPADAEELNSKLDADKLPEAVNDALAQAKESGEFDGKDGQNGKDGTSVTVQSVNESAESGGSNVVTFSDGKTLTVKNGEDGKDGQDGQDGQDGNDYVLTVADKQEIAEQAAGLIDTALLSIIGSGVTA